MKQLIEEVVDCKGRLQDILEEMESLEDSMLGAEIKYNGNYASIMYADANRQTVCLYVEDEGENSWEVELSFDELLEIL